MAKNYRSFTSLGTAVLTAAPQALTVLFPGYADVNVWGIQFQTHEDNGAATLVYIGDGTLTNTGAEAAKVLKGPLVSYDAMTNQNAQNSFDPDEIYLFSSPLGGKIRVGLFLS
jgi:hypothetical protein